MGNSLPSNLSSYLKDAEKYISENLVRDVEFSGGTYQVLVLSPKKNQKIWAFLQIDERGEIKDCFCSCEHGNDAALCVHIAAAYLKIFNNQPLPLHQRFASSLWHQLTLLYADRLGDNADHLEHGKEGLFFKQSAAGKTIFHLKGRNAKGRDILESMLFFRSRETEETSLKFSNLSQEELNLWREGRPSNQLRYELSYWNDLAHWLMLQQEEGKPYKIHFDYSQKGIPNYITIKFPEIEIGFYLSEANLPLLIPALSTVKSPLKIHYPPQESIRKITFDKQRKTLFIESKTLTDKEFKLFAKASKNGIAIDGWILVKDDGFYPKEPRVSLLGQEKLTEKNIAKALNNYLPTIQNHLEDVVVHTEPINIAYTLNFDSEWNLHINGYAFNPGDLTGTQSYRFENWIYIDDDGFYPINEMHFPDIENIIYAEQVGDFVTQEQAWLKYREGFHTYLTSIEAQLTYSLSKDNRLTFSKVTALKDSNIETKDFGSWVYVVGQGFFSKSTTFTSLPVQVDIPIRKEQIPFFIRKNSEELQLVSKFFSEKNPIRNSGLDISLNDKDQVIITPIYDLFPEYEGKDVRFFDEYVYVDKEGFFELPANIRLPIDYRNTVEISSDELPFFIMHDLDALKKITKSIDPRLLWPKKMTLTATKMELDTDGYNANLEYETEYGSVFAADILKAFKEKKRFLFSNAGIVDLKDERFEWIKQLPKTKVERKNHFVHLSSMGLIRVNAIDPIMPAGESVKQILNEYEELKVTKEPDLKDLHGSLRPYQEVGVHWLWFLYQHKLSGLLCDDMGLGKTHQAMALLAAVRKEIATKPAHFLIICPTSVIYHWEEKLREHLPGVRICTFHGSDRSFKEFHQQYDVLLTSYGIWRMEKDLLSQVSFEVAIFDEIQVAKNQNSLLHASLLSVKAKMRIGLSGTPIENRLRELKALFDLVLPHYMPPESDFKEIFVKPIEKEGDRKRQELLRRFIKPFVLRRKKEEVLTELPEKVEEVAHCDLEDDQRTLYSSVLMQSRQHILEQLKDDRTPIPYLHVFAILSSLKQICNHPAAYLKTPDDYKNYHSGKWELFLELLSEARESKQKVVIFSQYLAMLDIMELHMNEEGIGFAKIRGSTVDRGAQVHRFNKDPDCEVFLGSLQASGLGLNLTAGSVVIHYDRWWNAAREDQATDRVHRIGQTRGVQVFKLVTKGTFEERIDAMITKKSKLLEEIVSTDDQRFIKQFSRTELIELLEDVEEASAA